MVDPMELKRLREQAKLDSDKNSVPAPNNQGQEAIKVEATIDPREQRRLAAQARQQLAEKTKPFKKELDHIDQRLPQLNATRTALEEKLATPGLTGSEIAEAGKQLKLVNDDIDQLEERWLELSEQIEALQQAVA